MKNYKLLSTLAIATIVLLAGCKKDDYVETIGVCPVVISTDPANAVNSVPYNKVITATFNEKMNAATITGASFIVQQGTTNIAGTVTAVDAIASFTPTSPLLPFTEYKGTIKTTVKDLMGNALQKDHVWTFTTMAQITLVSNPIIGGITSGGGAYAMGATVTVTATPNVGYVFVSWTENGTIVSPVIAAKSGNNVISGKEVSTSSSYQFIMTGNRTLTANFAVIVLGNFAINLSSNPAAGGTTSGNGTFVENSVKTVSATANTGYTFTNWAEGGLIVSTNATYQLAALVANRTLVANFTPIPYTVAVSSLPTSGGTTSGDGTFNYGTSVTVNAVPSAGFAFSNWTEGATVVSTNANYQFTISGNRTLVANYITIPYTVAVSSLPILGGTTTGAGTFNYGTSVTVSAVPNAGFTFTNWTEGTTVVSTNGTYLFTITGNRTLVANYAAISGFNVTVSSNPLIGGLTTGGGTFNSGTSVTVTAVPNAEYTFTNWTEGVNIVSTNGNYQFNITGNRILVANYAAIVIPPSGPATIDLGCAAPFAILAGSTITSTGPSIITGNVGLSAGSELVGFPPGIIIGTQEITTPTAAAAKLCLTSAFLDGQGRSLNAISLPGNLGGLTLVPGLYHNSISSGISGTGANGILTLEGNANDVWIFQIGSTLTTDPATSIVLAGGAQAKNIFWIVGTSATLGTTSVFYGNILAQASITLNTGAVLNGRALTQIAAVTLDASIVTKPQ